MKKTMNKVIASTNFPMIIASTKNTSTIRVRTYKDPKTGVKVMSNYSARPISPISGKALIPVGSKVMTLSEAEIDSLESLGVCPECGAELKCHEDLANEIECTDKLYCTVCGEELNCEEVDEMLEEEIPAESGCKHCASDEMTLDDIESSADDIEELPDDASVPQQVEASEENAEDIQDKMENFQGKMIENYQETTDKAGENLIDNEAEQIHAGIDEIAEDQASEDANASDAEEVRVDMLAKCQANLRGKEMEIIASTKDTYHYLMISRKPVATLHKARAVAAVQDIFEDRAALEDALESAITEDDGFSKDVCSAFGIVPLVLKVQANDAIEQAVSEKEKELSAEFEEKAQEMEEDYDQCLGMAAVAANRNLIAGVKNVLAEDLTEKLESLGVEDGRELVESSFAKYGEDWLRTIVAQAKEYKKESAQSRDCLARTILASTYQKKELGHKVVSNVVEPVQLKESNLDVDTFRANLAKLI